MTGSFSSLNTALTALRYHRVTLDVASNNVANAATEGYTRRRAVGESLGAGAVPALWSRYPDGLDAVGGGVGVKGVDRLSDGLLDARSRSENGRSSYLQLRSTVLQRVESGIGEPGTTGVAASLSSFRASWHDLANTPESGAARGQVLARAEALVDAVHAQAAAIDEESATQRVSLMSQVSEVNTRAGELAATNRAISAAALDGVDASDLLDQRDQIAMRLAQLTGGKAVTRPDGGFDFNVGSVALVSGVQAGTLAIATGVTATGAADGNPVTLSVTLNATTTTPGALGGEIGATTELLDTTLPGYASGLANVVETLATQVNGLHTAGYDATGAAGQPFFSFTAGDAARTLGVNLTSATQVAAAATAGGVIDGTQADRLAATGSAEDAYTALVTGFGTQVASAQRLSSTQDLLTQQVDSAREQLSGVNLDEEMVTMLAAQRAYEAAARVMTVVDSVLDTLINRTAR